jgi:hypothetical protein
MADNLESKGKYPENTDMSRFTHLLNIGHYNSNYYQNAGDLLYGKSDDDDTTEWYLICGSNQPIYLGTTSTSQGDKYLRKGANT